MAVLDKRLKVAESKVTTPDDLEVKYINERVEWFTTGDDSVLKTPCPQNKPLITFYHIVKEKMKEQGLKMHPSFIEEVNHARQS